MDVSGIGSVGVSVGALRGGGAQQSAGESGEAAETTKVGPDNDGDQDDRAQATGKGTKLNTIA